MPSPSTQENQMPLEKQLTSLSLSKALREAGVPQVSQFYWVDFVDGLELKRIDWSTGATYHHWNKFSAYSVAELGEMLPTNKIRTMKIMGHWFCELYDYSEPEAALSLGKHREVADTEANARAQMILYLLKEKLITL
jgi:hypothetical protein